MLPTSGYTLRDDGVSYGDYLEQLTYLIFLKMADEYSKPPYKRDLNVPEKYAWPALKAKSGSELEGHYIELLRELGQRKDVLGQIFTKAQNKKEIALSITFMSRTRLELLAHLAPRIRLN